MENPVAIDFDAQGRAYVLERGNDRIQVFGPSVTGVFDRREPRSRSPERIEPRSKSWTSRDAASAPGDSPKARAWPDGMGAISPDGPLPPAPTSRGSRPARSR